MTIALFTKGATRESPSSTLVASTALDGIARTGPNRFAGMVCATPATSTPTAKSAPPLTATSGCATTVTGPRGGATATSGTRATCTRVATLGSTGRRTDRWGEDGTAETTSWRTAMPASAIRARSGPGATSAPSGMKTSGCGNALPNSTCNAEFPFPLEKVSPSPSTRSRLPRNPTSVRFSELITRSSPMRFTLPRPCRESSSLFRHTSSRPPIDSRFSSGEMSRRPSLYQISTSKPTACRPWRPSSVSSASQPLISKSPPMAAKLSRPRKVGTAVRISCRLPRTSLRPARGASVVTFAPPITRLPR
mmetsp:Transcript_14939/g.37857  ORF Transcript_14939/g.37857 Transcript_14939/m.37857 type:complete len:307 (+) Transcript_14939:530-1450(+)